MNKFLKRYCRFLLQKFAKKISNLQHIILRTRIQKLLADDNVICKFDNQLIELDLNILTHNELFYTGYLEFEITAFIISLLRIDTIFFDIGANIGYFSCIGAKRIKQGKVYSFEPSPTIFQKLNRNVELNRYKNVVCEELAVAANDGQIDFFPELRSNNQEVGKLFSLTPESKSVQVECIKLDSYIEKNKIKNIDLIKIDVEGAEYAVLAGMSQILSWEKAPSLIIELHPEELKLMGSSILELKRFLVNKGYNLYRLIKGIIVEEYLDTEDEQRKWIFARKN